MCLLAQERLKRKSALIRASMRQADKTAMAQHVAVLRAGPKAGAEPPRAGTTKSTYHAPPTQEGWLAWATPNGSTRRYYRLVGSYLVRYADEEAARGKYHRHENASHSTNAQARRPSRPTPTARKP